MNTNKIVITIIGAIVLLFIGYQTGVSGASGKFGSVSWGRNWMAGGNGMTGMMQMMGGSLSGLSGDDLDSAFIQMMIPHHEGAVVMCQSVVKDGKREELKSFCQNIIKAQTSEIEQMKVWGKQWFTR